MNDFREWLSDNLRYILLILGILVILVGLFFGVRALSRRFGSSGNDEFSSDSLVSNVSSTVTEASESASSSVSENTGGDLEENAIPEITKLIEDYYTAVEQQDVAKVRTLCDTLPDTESAKIASSAIKYTDLKVYTKKGPDADSYVVYAYYHYQNEGQSTSLPGLARMLVRKNADGNWQIIYSDYDQATTDYIDTLENEDDVKALVERVQQELDEAQSSASENAASSVESAASSSESSAPQSEDSSASQSDTQTEEPAETPAPTAEPTPTPAPAETHEETSGNSSGNSSSSERHESSGKSSSSERKSSGRSSSSTRTAALQADCYIRSAPSYSGSILGQLKKGTEVTVIGDIKDGWWHIRTGNYEGYVGRRFIS